MTVEIKCDACRGRLPIILQFSNLFESKDERRTGSLAVITGSDGALLICQRASHMGAAEGEWTLSVDRVKLQNMNAMKKICPFVSRVKV